MSSFQIKQSKRIDHSIRCDVPEDLDIHCHGYDNIHCHGYDNLKSHNEPHTHMGGTHFLASPVVTE